MTLRFVALDLGNVLCDLDTHAFAASLARLTGRTVEDVQRAFDDQAHQALERGALEPQGFRDSFARGLGVPFSAQAFDDCWTLIPTPRAGADALVERLRVPHAIWSNTDAIHIASLTPRMRCIRSARHAHMSFTARCRKPDAAYYAAGLSALGAQAHEVLFIDDRADNRDAAAALGIVVEPALTLAEVEAALHRHRLLSPAPGDAHV